MKTIRQVTEAATETAADIFVISFLLTISVVIVSLGILLLSVAVRLFLGGA